uniref:CMP/dCMP-type deaminase domain-containing protein n=1 Tax=Amphimedon queenslandica TaxID=400682 RepID=A0A1X7STY1_AMPQE
MYTKNVKGSGKRPVATGSRCSLDEAAHYAFTNSGTLLYARGTIYWSEEYKHAEEVFIDMTRDEDIRNIKIIWIKNSPCCWCADKLIEHFSKKYNKPTVYIGKIWSGAYGDADSNKEGLRKMKRNGFELLAWKHYKNKDEYETREYLRNIDSYSCIVN